MGWLRAWRCRRREKAMLKAALVATSEALAIIQAEHHTAEEFGRHRNETLRRQTHALQRRAVQINDLQGRLYALATPTGTPCSKLSWHTKGEAQVFGDWLEAATRCGEMVPYACVQCRPHVITGQRVWHSTHVDEARRGLANETRTTISSRLPPEMLRTLQERFASASDEWVSNIESS
jgi:hypothetical protein